MAARVFEIISSVYGFDDTGSLVVDNAPEFEIIGQGGVELGGVEYVVDDVSLYKLVRSTLALTDTFAVNYAAGEEPASSEALTASTMTGLLYILATSGGGPSGLEVLEINTAGVIQRRLPLPAGSTTLGINNTAIAISADGTKLHMIAANPSSVAHIYEMVIATGVVTSLALVDDIDVAIEAAHGNDFYDLSSATGLGEHTNGNIYISGLNATVAVINHAGTLQQTLISGQPAVGGSFYAMVLDSAGQRVWAVGQNGAIGYLIALGFDDSVALTNLTLPPSSAPSLWLTAPPPLAFLNAENRNARVIEDPLIIRSGADISVVLPS